MLNRIIQLLHSSAASSILTPVRRKPTQRICSRRLHLESLERRELMAAGLSAALVAPSSNHVAAVVGTASAQPASQQAAGNAVPAVAQDINQTMVAFLQSKLGKRLGGGECGHIATEALRFAGAQFIATAADNPNPGDYVWGDLVKVVQFNGVTAVDSNPLAAVKPGDILQYHDASFTNGKHAAHHTSVVAEVDAQGRPTVVFEQNIDNQGVKGIQRYVTRQPIDLSKLNAGWIRVYHPVARQPVANQYQFTIVNNTVPNQSVPVTIGGNSIFSLNLGTANTAGSYMTGSVTSFGTKPKLQFNSQSLTIVDGAAYELYTRTDGVTAIRRILVH